MNAIFIMPPKFLAVFSNREKTLRFSFIQPITRSTIFRFLYNSLLGFVSKGYLYSDSPFRGVTIPAQGSALGSGNIKQL